MKKNIIIGLCLVVILILFGSKYVNVNLKKVGSSLPAQEGLPAVVEAKRQAILKASASRDMAKLKAEYSDKTYQWLEYDDKGKSKNGLSGYTELTDYEKNISLFDLYPALLNSPYVLTEHMYVWPSVAPKTGVKWAASDVAYLKKFLTDRQIELLEGYYTYPKIVITEDGEWTNYAFLND